MRLLTEVEQTLVSGAGNKGCHHRPRHNRAKGNNGWGNGREGTDGPNGKFPEDDTAFGFKEDGNR